MADSYESVRLSKSERILSERISKYIERASLPQLGFTGIIIYLAHEKNI